MKRLIILAALVVSLIALPSDASAGPFRNARARAKTRQATRQAHRQSNQQSGGGILCGCAACAQTGR